MEWVYSFNPGTYSRGGGYQRYYLIPDMHDPSITDRLRSTNNSQLFLQGLIGLKTRLYAMVSPTTNDIDSYFIV